MMERPQIVLFADKNGKVYSGKVTYYDNWYEEHLAGKDAKIFDVEFDKDNVPDELRDRDIPRVISCARKDFKEKTGMTWEEFNALQYWG